MSNEFFNFFRVKVVELSMFVMLDPFNPSCDLSLAKSVPVDWRGTSMALPAVLDNISLLVVVPQIVPEVPPPTPAPSGRATHVTAPPTCPHATPPPPPPPPA